MGSALIVFVAIAYRRGFALPFLNDDYVILEKVRPLTFAELWLPEQLVFSWYRPLSREFHYWAMHNVFALNEVAYHVVSACLWVAILLLYFGFVRRLAGQAAATISTAGVATLALWGAPLLWIAGVQDLWMLFFSLLFLHLLDRPWALSLIALLFALLSKETAASLPAIATAYHWLVGRDSLAGAFRRTVSHWALVAVWFALHPTLPQRLFGHLRHTPEVEGRPSILGTFFKTLLAQVNLEDRIAPEMGWGVVVARGAVVGFILAVPILVAGWPRTSQEPTGSTVRPRVASFGALWAAFGWGALFMPSIGWHAYYGVLGTLGCWLLVGTALRRHVLMACLVVVSLAVLRDARASTPSWDWGTYWYQKRSGSFLEAIRHKLFGLYPTLPPYSRVYIARLPNNIGLLGGNGPAIRIWYNDPTLEAGFYSAYVTRLQADTLGRDIFVRFDTLTALVEVIPARSHNTLRHAPHGKWQRDHEVLASLFIRGGNTRGAAEQYEALWAILPRRIDYALYAATAYEAIGDTSKAFELYAICRRTLGDSLVAAQAATLVESARAFRAAALQRARIPPTPPLVDRVSTSPRRAKKFGGETGSGGGGPKT